MEKKGKNKNCLVQKIELGAGESKVTKWDVGVGDVAGVIRVIGVIVLVIVLVLLIVKSAIVNLVGAKPCLVREKRARLKTVVAHVWRTDIKDGKLGESDTLGAQSLVSVNPKLLNITIKLWPIIIMSIVIRNKAGSQRNVVGVVREVKVDVITGNARKRRAVRVDPALVCRFEVLVEINPCIVPALTKKMMNKQFFVTNKRQYGYW